MMVVTGKYAPGLVTGLISAAIICATMSSADSNLLCMSTMVINDLYKGFGGKKELTEKQIIFYTRCSNVIAAVVAIIIALFRVDIVTMNTFAFGIRCAGPFAAYGLGLVVPKATKNSGLISILAGTAGFVVWQILCGSNSTYLYLMPVVFGCLVSVITFFLVNAIEWARGVEPAPSAYLTDDEVKAKIAEENA
jgi:SSS family solute:Na+ symporter